MVNLTIGVVARDRFSKGGQCLRRLVEVTSEPHRLLVVDAGTPQRYRKEMERAVVGHPNVEFLRAPDFMNPNAAKNWVIREAHEGEWLALIENDNLMPPGWFEGLVRACEEERADVGRPMMMERKLWRTFPHFDQRLGSIETVEREGGRTYRFAPRTSPLARDVMAPRQRTTVLETHALLFRRSVFDKIGGFDENLSTRQEVDLALSLYADDIPVVFEPAVQVTYLAPPPVERAERPFYQFRWNMENAKHSHRVIEEKWGMEKFPGSVEFARFRHDHMSYLDFARYFVRWELSHYLRYGAYRISSHLPGPLRAPIHRALYG